VSLFASCAKKESKPTAPGTRPPFEPIGAFDQAALMGRGVNLGNALEAPDEGDWGLILQAEYFRLIAGAGFNHVRIPITWATHILLDLPPYPVDPGFFDRVDWAVDQALDNGLIAVVNHHHYDALDADPERTGLNAPRDIFLGIWRQISERYRDYSNTVIFEINNEPHGRFNAANWDALWKETLAVIRETNPERNVIVGPIDWNSIYALNTLRLPDPEEDAHLIVTFHYYNPHRFTHQCAAWAGDPDCNWLGTTWGTDAEYNTVMNDFRNAVQWAEGVNRPLYLGEFGVYERADMDSRVRWTGHLARTAEAYHIPWAYWEFGAGFGIYDREANAWRTRLLGALIPTEG